MSILTFIAGHKGMVGQSLVRHGHSKGFDLLTAQRNQLDLADSRSVHKYFRKHKPDSVILAAAKVGGIYANSSNQSLFLSENIKIQNSVILGALEAGIDKLLFLGSSCVYPKLSPQPIHEDSLLTGPLESTNEGYAIAKIAGIKLCQYIREEHGLNFFSLMPTNLYGPGDNFDLKESHVPAALFRKFHEAKTAGSPAVAVWGTGSPYREFMHVDDLANAIWYLHENPPNEYLINVGFGQEITIAEFARKIAEVVDYKGAIEFDNSMPDGTPRKLLDSSKLSALGWRPKISLDEGLRLTYDWFVKNIGIGGVRGYVQ